MGALVLIVLIFSTLTVGGIFLSLKAFRLQSENKTMKTQLIAEKRNDPVAWVGIAHELEQKGDLIDAERACRKAIQLKPDYKDAWMKLGNLLKKQGKSTDAKTAFRRADELKSDLEK